MQTISYGYRGLWLLARLNSDRLLMGLVLLGALLLAGYLAALAIPLPHFVATL